MKKMTYEEMDAIGIRFRTEFTDEPVSFKFSGVEAPVTPEMEERRRQSEDFWSERMDRKRTASKEPKAAKGKVSQGSCESGSVPTPETMPPTEAKPFTHREGVHQFHDFQPTMWTMKHCKNSAQHTTADTVVRSVTRMTGRANKSQWKTNGTTKRGVKRMAEKQARAQKWIAKFDR